MANVFVTGGAGFIGGHLVEALLGRGDHVTVVDDESTGSSANLRRVIGNERLRYLRGSVTDRKLLAGALEGVKLVFHLAAAVGVQLIASNPIHTIETNIYPTELLLQEMQRMRAAGQDVTLFVASTSEVYGKNPKPRWTEDDDLVFGPTTRPRWSYGVSKAIDEFLALAYFRQHGLPVVVGRFFNVVGPRQTGRYGMVLPRFVGAALEGRPLVVHGDGRQVRCFAHVGDIVSMVLELVANPSAVGRVFNIGGDQPIAILDLARKVVAAVNPRAEIIFQSYAEAYSEDFEDVHTRIPDLGRLHATIGYRPRRTLDDTIADVAASLSGADSSK